MKIKATVVKAPESTHVRLAVEGDVPSDVGPLRFIGYELKKNDDRLAARLVRAINDGVGVGPVTIKTDVHGVKYLSADMQWCGRYLNADLKRNGY